MKYTLMFLSLISISLATNLSQANEVEAYNEVTGIYKLTFDSAKGECPERVRVTQLTEDSLSFSALGGMESLDVEDGEKDKIKLSEKESYQIKGSFDDFEARLEGRYCKGKIFKRCEDWEVLAMIDWNGEDLTISHRASAYMPRSGFPNGTCSYQRGL